MVAVGPEVVPWRGAVSGRRYSRGSPSLSEMGSVPSGLVWSRGGGPVLSRDLFMGLERLQRVTSLPMNPAGFHASEYLIL
jgi:hypothetical protein